MVSVWIPQVNHNIPRTCKIVDFGACGVIELLCGHNYLTAWLAGGQRVFQNVSMPRKRKKQPLDGELPTPKQGKSDRHRPSRLVRVREVLALQLDILVNLNATDITEEVNRAVRELLLREKLWPPAGTD